LLSHSSYTILAARGKLPVARLLHSPSLPFSPLSIIHIHQTMLCLTHTYCTYCLISFHASNVFFCRLALVLEIEILSETLHARGSLRRGVGGAARFVLDARGGRVTCATECEKKACLCYRLAREEQEGHHDNFARRTRLLDNMSLLFNRTRQLKGIRAYIRRQASVIAIADITHLAARSFENG